MTNLTPPDAAHTPNLTNRERWEVIVHHEAPFLFALVALQPLRVVRRAQRRAHQSLRLTTRKQSRTMHPRQHSNFDRQVANLIKCTMIRTNSVMENLVAEDLLAQNLVVLAQLFRSIGVALGELLLQLILDRLHLSIALELRILLRIQRILQTCANLRRKSVQILLIDLNRTHQALRLPRAAHQVFDRRTDLLDLLMRKFNRIDNALFRNLLRARLNHHDAVLRADDHDVQQALRTFRIRGIHNKLIVHNANPHRAYWPVKRNIAQRQRTTRAVDPQHIRIIFLIRGVNKRHNLRLIPEGLGKQRPDRTIDLPARQNLLLARPSLTLNKSAGNPSTCVRKLAILHSQREKVDSLFRVWRSHSRC